MARKIIGGVVILVVLVIAVVWYRNSKAQENLGSGDVYPVNTGPYTQPNSAATVNVPPTSTTSNQPPGGAPAAPATAYASQTSTAPPTADSEAPNAADNVRFTGSGRYQWYRQGNLTWRVDTQTGNTCVAFATDEEWRKPRVYQNGCANR